MHSATLNQWSAITISMWSNLLIKDVPTNITLSNLSEEARNLASVPMASSDPHE